MQQFTGAERDFDGIVMGWNLGFELDDTGLFHSDQVDQPNGLSGTQNPEMDALMEQIRVTSDREVALDLWAEYQRLLIEEQPYMFAFFQDRLTGINKRVMGMELDARGEFQNLKEWYLDPASR